MYKLFEEHQVGYYEVSSDNFGGAHFFIGIDKVNKSIQCYVAKDFSSPIRIIKFDNADEMIGGLPGVSASILGRVVIKALQVFEMNNFPSFLDYAS